MSSLLDIWWIQILIWTKCSKSRWNYVWKLHFIHQPWKKSLKYYWNRIQECKHWLWFLRIGKECKESFWVLSCVIYKILSYYICIDYSGYEKIKLSYLHICVAGSYKNLEGKYDNVMGFRIPDLLLNLLSCQGFLKNNKCVFILKFPNRMFE